MCCSPPPGWHPIRSSRKVRVKDQAGFGDRDYMVAIQALITAITFTLVLMAVRLTIELDALEQE